MPTEGQVSLGTASRYILEIPRVQILSGLASGTSFAVWSPARPHANRCMLVLATTHNVTQMPFLNSRAPADLVDFFRV